MSTIYFSITDKFPSDELKSLPTKFKNSNRNHSYFLSRKALAHIAKTKFGYQTNYLTMELKDHGQITGRPQLSVSLSHTKDTVAALVGDRNDFYSVGIDIEFQTRTFSPEGQKYFINSDDSKDEELLILWCIKEAAFKALSNGGYPIKLLKEVVVEENNFYFIRDENKSKYPFKLIKQNGLIIALAACSKSNKSFEAIEVELS